MPMTAKQMVKLLEANGFEFVRSNGSHCLYRNPKTGNVSFKRLKARYRVKYSKTGRSKIN